MTPAELARRKQRYRERAMRLLEKQLREQEIAASKRRKRVRNRQKPSRRLRP